MTHRVIIALGSNVSRHYLAKGMPLFREDVHVDRQSDIIPTEAVANKSPPFANQLLRCTTDLTLDELTRLTKDTEATLGREHGRGVVSIDIDILRYDDTLLHLSDWEHEYVKLLFNQIQK